MIIQAQKIDNRPYLVLTAESLDEKKALEDVYQNFYDMEFIDDDGRADYLPGEYLDVEMNINSALIVGIAEERMAKELA